MTYTVKIPNGLITLCETDFKCPDCGQLHTEEDWYECLIKSKNFIITKQCKRCKTKLAITTNIKGDVVVWKK